MGRVRRCTWRARSSELRHALAACDRVNSEMHLEAVIELVWGCTRRPTIEIGGVLGGAGSGRRHDRS